MDNIWITILSSAGIASIISAISGYISTKRLQKEAFINDYYAMVINKRMEAYAIVNSVTNMLIVTTYRENSNGDTVLCSDFLINDNLKKERFDTIIKGVNNSIWLYKPVVDCLVDLNRFLYVKCATIDRMPDEADYAAQNRTEIIEYAHKLETLVAEDLLTLHDVEGFLKSKNKKDK